MDQQKKSVTTLFSSFILGFHPRGQCSMSIYWIQELSLFSSTRTWGGRADRRPLFFVGRPHCSTTSQTSPGWSNKKNWASKINRARFTLSSPSELLLPACLPPDLPLSLLSFLSSPFLSSFQLTEGLGYDWPCPGCCRCPEKRGVRIHLKVPSALLPYTLLTTLHFPCNLLSGNA